MNRRARAFAEQAVAVGAAWTRSLGPPPAAPARRSAWLREIATIAACRERWGVTGRDPINPDRASIERIGHEKRAQAAAERAARLAGRNYTSPPPATIPNPAAAENGLQL